MEYKIGDFVRFVDENIEGYVTSIQSDVLIGVTDVSGFEIPVLKSKVTKVYDHRETQNQSIPEKEIKQDKRPNKEEPKIQKQEDKSGSDNTTLINIEETEEAIFQAEGIYLGVSLKDKNSAELFIINQSSYTLLTSISEIEKNKIKGIQAEKIASKKAISFFHGNYTTLRQWPKFYFQILRFTENKENVLEPILKEIRIKAEQLLVEHIEIPSIHFKGYLIPLDSIAQREIHQKKENHLSHRPQSAGKETIKIKGKIDLSKFKK